MWLGGEEGVSGIYIDIEGEPTAVGGRVTRAQCRVIIRAKQYYVKSTGYADWRFFNASSLSHPTLIEFAKQSAHRSATYGRRRQRRVNRMTGIRFTRGVTIQQSHLQTGSLLK
ncbi:unnamed protein product [Nippostrongylus brasiliensis]|uniref:PEGA domain-containing protein n=1 Tax=Nippostrongylus brasiliensis TaxID=27835 RepID=A0A0N4YER0_NIPBR|nr:unnamed protein product [Nippostrongylus brasiliensis]